jgi:hypothetical protein
MKASSGTNPEDHPDSVKLDWVNLPSGVATISLWDSLHDGELTAVRSDLMDRSLSMEFQVHHVLDFHKLPERLSFIFAFVNVTSARATRWQKWPGQIRELKGLPYEEQTRLISEYQAKWREESDSWQSFEKRLATGHVDAPDIYNADLAQSDNAVAFRIEVNMEEQGFQVITVAAQNLSIRRSDGQLLSLEAFLQLGADYWTAFANRRPNT